MARAAKRSPLCWRLGWAWGGKRSARFWQAERGTASPGAVAPRMFEAAVSAAEFGAPRRRARAKGSLSAGQAAAYERTGAYRHAPELSNPTQRQRTGAYRHAPEPHHTDRGAYRHAPEPSHRKRIPERTGAYRGKPCPVRFAKLLQMPLDRWGGFWLSISACRHYFDRSSFLFFCFSA
jgi:hypothetical protein